MKTEIIGIIIAIVFGLAVFPHSFLYIISPETAKNISKKLGGLGRDRNFHKSSNSAIRIAGIFFLISGILFEIGLLAGTGVLK